MSVNLKFPLISKFHKPVFNSLTFKGRHKRGEISCIHLLKRPYRARTLSRKVHFIFSANINKYVSIFQNPDLLNTYFFKRKVICSFNIFPGGDSKNYFMLYSYCPIKFNVFEKISSRVVNLLT